MYVDRFVGGLLAVVVVVGCGDPDNGPPLAAPPPALTCADDLDEIMDLLQVGLPLYDYDLATDLEMLIERADAVVAGRLERLARADDGATIIIKSADLTHLGPDDVAAPASEFDIDNVWAERDIVDPLAEPVAIEGVRAVAFVVRRTDGSGRFTAMPQGLHIGCDGADNTADNAADNAARSVIDELPADVAGLSVDQLVTAVEAAFDEPVATTEPSRGEAVGD